MSQAYSGRNRPKTGHSEVADGRPAVAGNREKDHFDVEKGGFCSQDVPRVRAEVPLGRADVPRARAETGSRRAEVPRGHAELGTSLEVARAGCREISLNWAHPTGLPRSMPPSVPFVTIILTHLASESAFVPYARERAETEFIAALLGSIRQSILVRRIRCDKMGPLHRTRYPVPSPQASAPAGRGTFHFLVQYQSS